MGIAVFDSLLSGGERIYRNLAVSQRFDIRTIVQITKVVVYLVGGVAVLATLLGKSPLVFFSGLGAFTAVAFVDIQGHDSRSRSRDPVDRRQYGSHRRLDRSA